MLIQCCVINRILIGQLVICVIWLVNNLINIQLIKQIQFTNFFHSPFLFVNRITGVYIYIHSEESTPLDLSHLGNEKIYFIKS